jgi:hypothetical protein
VKDYTKQIGLIQKEIAKYPVNDKSTRINFAVKGVEVATWTARKYTNKKGAEKIIPSVARVIVNGKAYKNAEAIRQGIAALTGKPGQLTAEMQEAADFVDAVNRSINVRSAKSAPAPTDVITIDI